MKKKYKNNQTKLQAKKFKLRQHFQYLWTIKYGIRATIEWEIRFDENYTTISAETFCKLNDFKCLFGLSTDVSTGEVHLNNARFFREIREVKLSKFIISLNYDRKR